MLTRMCSVNQTRESLRRSRLVFFFLHIHPAQFRMRMAHITILLIFNLCLAIHSLADLQKKTSLSQNSKFVDSVVASVNGKPIMFSDIARHNKLEAHDQQTFKHLINDSKFRKALEDEIADQLIRAEAESKKITINASEVDSYLNQVAQRNNLSLSLIHI